MYKKKLKDSHLVYLYKIRYNLMFKVKGISFYYTETEKFEIIHKGYDNLIYQEYLATDCVSRGLFHAKLLFLEKNRHENHN